MKSEYGCEVRLLLGLQRSKSRFHSNCTKYLYGYPREHMPETPLIKDMCSYSTSRPSWLSHVLGHWSSQVMGRLGRRFHVAYLTRPTPFLTSKVEENRRHDWAGSWMVRVYNPYIPITSPLLPLLRLTTFHKNGSRLERSEGPRVEYLGPDRAMRSSLSSPPG